MITTRRSETNSINAFSSEASVALLERKKPATYNEYVAPATTGESAEAARARMQENLAKLLNYDRYSEQVQDVAPVIAPVETVETIDTQVSTAETMQETTAFAEDDIRPTSTTMQFGDGDIENLRMDMKKEEQASDVAKYRLNTKGKVVVLLYALVLTVVMALIAINTGVLARLSATEQSLSEEMGAKMQTLSAIETEIEGLQAPDYIGQQAAELGMIKK